MPTTLVHAPSEILVERVNVVDARTARPELDMDVLIRGNRIVSVRKSRYPSAPSGARVVDGRGKYLIPGLWDMHVHGTRNVAFAGIYLANGVTGIRDMFDMSGETFAVRADIRAGKLLGPRIVAAGRPIDGLNPVWPGSLTVGGRKDAKEAVDFLISDGSDFIKVYSMISREAFYGVVAEAKRRHIPFVGHVPESVTATEASDAGMKSEEHLYGLLRQCSPQFTQPVNVFTSRTLSFYYNNRWLDSFDPKLAAKLIRTLKKNHTYIDPTLTVLSWLRHPEDPHTEMQHRFAYMPKGTEGRFEVGRKDRYASWTPADFRLEKRMFEKDLYFVRELNRAGVPILAGTDVTNPYCFPGFGLHDELHWLVRAGLTPRQALRAATLTPAEFFGWQKDLGTVEPGKIADCVLVDANPLANIDNARNISAVFLGGRYLNRAALKKLMPLHPKQSLSMGFTSGAGDDGFY